MKFKTTKSALLSSVVILAMCFSMFVGSTYAWFTDSVSSAGNVIQSGNLDIEFWMYNEKDSKYEDISSATKPIFGANSLLADWDDADLLWEPGKTQIVYLGVKNAGSLDLKYNVVIDVVDQGLVGALEYAIIDGAEAGALTLNDWDDVKAACNGQTADIAPKRTIAATNGAIAEKDAADYFALAIHMKEEAGNEYQNKSITVDINIVATQLANEEDSFGTDYDADATFDEINAGFGALEDGASAVQIEVRNNAGYKVASAVVPAGAVGDSAVSVTVVPSAPDANISITGDETIKSFDVKVTGLKENNTELVKVSLRIPEGLDPATVRLYHNSELIASTYNPNTGYVTFESATFSPYSVVYDAESEYEAPVVNENTSKPTANVVYASEYVNAEIEWGNYGQWSPTEGLEANLEAAFVFSCPEEDDGTFDNWYCDFYVSLDRALGENQIFLGGNYGSFGWVGFHNNGFTLDANKEIGLLESVTTNPWTYSDVKNFVGEFTCGVGDVNNALEGATFTVKLRLTNPENSAKFYDVNVVTYTFGGSAVIDGATVALTAQDIQDAINNGVENVVLGNDVDLNDLSNLFN